MSLKKDSFRHLAIGLPALAFVIYFFTAYRSITWWDSAEYALAAATLGVAHPPGSLLLTLLGWPISWLVSNSAVAFALNLFAALIASVTLGLLAGLIRSILSSHRSTRAATWPIWIASIFAIGMLGFGFTFWRHAMKFTPYILTALFTVLILIVMLSLLKDKLRDGKIFKLLFLLGILFGLDISVHRTNLLLTPAVLVLIFLSQKRLRFRLKTWLMPILGGLLGLSFHLLTIALAARRPFLNSNDPSNWQRFIDYVSLKQYGGSFLINLWPRKQDFFSGQVIDYVDDFVQTFSVYNTYETLTASLITLLGIYGMVVLWRTKRNSAILLLALFLLSSVGAIIYFNTPSSFFRPFDRHYLPSFVIFAIFPAVALGSLIDRFNKEGADWLSKLAAVMIGLLAIVLPIHNATARYDSLESSNRKICHTYANEMLEQLEPNAILFTGGDTDTYPLWYVQQVEQVRRDVTVLNYHLLNTLWYSQELVERRPNFPTSMDKAGFADMSPIAWPDSTVLFEVAPPDYNTMLVDSTVWPDSVSILVTSSQGSGYQFVSGQFLIDFMQTNEWRRPVYFSAGATHLVPYLADYFRNEGFVQMLLPVKYDVSSNPDYQRSILEKYSYTDLNNEAVAIETPTKWAYNNLYITYVNAALDLAGKEDSAAARNMMIMMRSNLPEKRLEPDEGMMRNIAALEDALLGRMPVDSTEVVD